MENNLAVLIDFENIAAGTEKEGLGRFDVDSLMQRVKDKGRILVARSYADWGRFSRFKQSLLAANVTMMELTSHGMQDKNRADIAMVVDALELAFTRAYVDTFVVVSGDSDFTPLVLKMRELNKRVIGIGTRKSTSRLLIQACDEFMFYDSIVQPKAKRRKPEGHSSDVTAAFELLHQALDGMQRENPEAPLASVVKSAVLRKSPDFNESDLGFSSFARFLDAAQDAGVVRITRDTKSGGYRVDAPDDAERPATEETAAEESDWVDSYLPKGSESFVDALSNQGVHPMAASTRLALLEALVAVVSERSKKRRKTTVQFVREDVKKKVRRTHPDLPMSMIKALLDALMRAGELIHRDGTAIRSSTAPFALGKDAEELNEALSRLYLRVLRDQGIDLADTRTLADLIYGDPDRRREVEETLAYLLTEAETEGDPESEPVHRPDDTDGDDLDLDLDDLLVAAPKEGKGRGKSGRSGRSRTQPEPATNGHAHDAMAVMPDLESLLEESPAPKRKRTRRKSDDAEAGETEVAARAEAEPAPKKSRGRRTKKKDDAPADNGDLSDLDALLEPQ